MSDTIGRITVPTVINSGCQTFPLTTQHPFGFSVERPMIVHRFGSLDAKQEQRYYAGIGPANSSSSGPTSTGANPASSRRSGSPCRGHGGRSPTTCPIPMAQPPACWSPSRAGGWSGSNACEVAIVVVDPSRDLRVGALGQPMPQAPRFSRKFSVFCYEEGCVWGANSIPCNVFPAVC
jgi:hypothetical protein